MNCYFGHHRSGSSYIRSILEAITLYSGKSTETIHNLHEFKSGMNPELLIATNGSQAYLDHFNITKGFHVIRDPRDVVVSSYFSHRYSHKTDVWKELITHRDQLANMSKEDGLIYEIENCRKQQFEDMYDWNYKQDHIIELKFEDMIIDKKIFWNKVLNFLNFEIKKGNPSNLGAFVLNVNKTLKKLDNKLELSFFQNFYLKQMLCEKQIEKTVNRFDFVAKSGRLPGSEDVNNHYRKGVSGDWRNHFSSQVKEVFKNNWGELLIKLGYEKDMNW